MKPKRKGGQLRLNNRYSPRKERVVWEVPELVPDEVKKLKAIFPQVVAEGKVDFEKLRSALGDSIDRSPDRFTFSWAGKRNAVQILQMPTRATLVPAKDESVEFSDTGNVFVEGDNLEVLKLLYKPYFGRIRMIYIDPPYNTGRDFVYQDNYTDPLETYLRITGQKSAEGNLLTSNPETSGRFHSSWLSMMYPRLFLARQLLSEDGVIFVSIDDNEVANLKQIMNEIFGDENFVTCVTWQKKVSPSNDAKWFSSDHDYILIYAKAKQTWRPNRLKRSKEQEQYYKNPDNDPRGPWNSATYTCNKSKEERPNLYYPLTNPTTGKKIWPKETAVWAYSREQYEEHVSENRIYWGKDGASESPRLKLFLSEAGNIVPRSIWPYDEVGHTQEATGEFHDIMPEGGFDTPKPTRLIHRMLELSTRSDDGSVVLDFFAGSCSTAQAVLEMNMEDGGNRRFIMVQLPEKLDARETRAIKAGFNTVADVGKERIRRTCKRLRKEMKEKLPSDKRVDLGFKVFRLSTSNSKPWKGLEERTPENYATEMREQIDPLVKGWKEENVIYEVALKEGFGLNSGIEAVKEYTDNRVWRVNDSDSNLSFLICLDDKLTSSFLRKLDVTKETLFVCREAAIDDTIAANLALQCRLKTM